MAEITRVLGGIVGMPLGAVGRALHGAVTGGNAVVEVDVERIDTALERARFLESFALLAEDDCVAAVLLTVQHTPGNWAACHDLRQAIRRVRAAGKPVYAQLDAPGNATLWLAAACDQVFVPPTTEVGLVGLGIEVTFFGALLERLGVRPDFDAAGAYKSAAEPFSRSFPSPANHHALQSLVDELHALLVAELAEDRGLEPEAVERAMAEAPLPAERAKELGLVDQLVYRDGLRAWLDDAHGSNLKVVGFESWAMRARALAQLDSLGQADGTVVVLHLEGNIVMDDKGSGEAIRAQAVVPILDGLTEDDSVAAVVLHVNSNGGSALASDLIWREVERLRAAKPVIACFEDVSASGGVYLSASASEIIVRPGTLTGSIGVVGGKLVVGEGLRKVGVHSQQIAAAPNANVFSATRPFTPEQRVRFRDSLHRFYDNFVQRVADGRNRDPAEVEPHCRGRLWTGAAAHERGLVDRLGTLDDAVDRAATAAGLGGRRIARRHLSGTPRNPVQKLVQDAVRRAVPGAASAQAWLGRLGLDLSPVVGLLTAHGAEPLAWMPWEIRLR